MSARAIPEIEAQIARLSPTEQLRLLEDVLRLLRNRLAGSEGSERSSFGDELAVMARDREVRAELQAIGEEFAATECDGLTRD